MPFRLRNSMKRCFVIITIAGLLLTQAALLGWSATRHSPTLNEPGHLVAGLSHWEFGRFDVYCVNPPLVHYVAALPVLLAGYHEDWSGFDDSPGARPEYEMGEDFLRANPSRAQWLVTIARWCCIPFALLGCVLCFVWSRELWGSSLAGILSATLWCFDPNVLAHGELVTPDCAAATLGLGACWLFWRWLKVPGWGRALAMAAMLTTAELAKFSWTFLFLLFPSIAATQVRRHRPAPHSPGVPKSWFQSEFCQLGVMLALALYAMNLAYGLDGSFSSLGSYEFVSSALGGNEPGKPGNRFRSTLLAHVPVPLPADYVRGVDLQKKDFEHYGQPSYLRGEWKDGGWWYYYLYGLWVKMPHGTQALTVISAVVVFQLIRTKGLSADFARDLAVLLLPPLLLIVMVSSQTGFNHHVRYVLPAMGFCHVFCGAAARLMVPVDGRTLS